MIKNNTENIKQTAPATVASDVFERLVVIGNPQKSALLVRTAQLERDIRGCQQVRSETRNTINRAYRGLLDTQERERRYKHELRQAKRELDSFDDSETRKRMTTMVDNIRKLRYVDSVSLDGDRLVIDTRLIFTDIRTGSGSRDYKRRCIGAFRIIIHADDNRFYIQNRLFPRLNNPHWTVGSSGNPCYGEHEDYFESALRERDYFMLLEYIYAFLRSTDDGAAYLPSNNWIDERRDRYGRATPPTIRKGNYVIVHTAYGQYNPDEHCQFGEVVRCHHGNIYVAFKKEFEFGHNLRGLCEEGRGYRVPIQNVAKITKKQFDEESVNATEIRERNPLDELDALPFGSTLQDAKKII